MAAAGALASPAPQPSEEEQHWPMFIAFAKELSQEAIEAASSNWDTPEPWREDRATDSQLTLIRFRRCGPDFKYRLPEALYKSILYVITGGTSSRNIRSKGEATDVLNTFAYTDKDVLLLWGSYSKKVANGELRITTQAGRSPARPVGSGNSDHAIPDYVSGRTENSSGGNGFDAEAEDEKDRRRRVAQAFYAELGDEWESIPL